jgi:hypothetical protein
MMFGQSNHALMVDAIVGHGVPNIAVAEVAVREGLATFTGNQWNENWAWNRQALSNLTEPTLRELLVALRAYADRSGAPRVVLQS